MPDEFDQTEILAIVLMSGFIEDLEKGKPQKKYLDDEEELRARAAMARLLRSGLPLTQDFRDRLAALFDPNDDTHPAIDRKLFFKRRSGRRRRPHVRNTAIARYVYSCICKGDGVEVAQQKAAEFFGLSPSAVRDIWGHKKGEGYRRLIDLL
jgi:hypothetical protein